MQVHCPGYGDDGEPDFDVTMVDYVKLFRNRPDLRFDHRIHEQLLPAIRAAGGKIAWSDLYVVHSGSDQSPEGRTKKLECDLRILHLELSERPEHPFTLFNLGMTYCHASRYAEAVDYLERGIARSGVGEPHLRKEFALLMFAWTRLGRQDLAMDACKRGRSLFPHDPELRFREAVVLQDLGRLDEARPAYHDVLNHRGEERHFSSADRALTGYKTRQNLAVLALDTGDLAEAEQHWREVVRTVPLYRQGWRGLSKTFLLAGRFAELDSLAESLSSVAELQLEGLLIKSRSAKAQGALPEARDALDRALAERPDDWATLCERSRFLFEHGTTDEADEALRALLDRRPDDASAYHNRGIVLMKLRRCDEAVEAYRQSLRYRPNYAGTYLSLGYALRDRGRVAEAVTAWEEAARLAPSDATARHELERLASQKN